ncbi:MAG: class I SAM-dependent methyltransferase [Gallionellaceae bacterium]
MGTAHYRHIQSLHESNDRRNPDILAGALMIPEEREQCFRISAEALMKMRKTPYYFYLIARTKFYDQLVLDAVAAGVRRVLIVGAGFDTRFYRFGGHLAAYGVEVAECDQPDAATIKENLAKTLPYSERVRYLSADLNRKETWNDLSDWLSAGDTQPTLVFAEGVSPYVESSAFLSFLTTLASLLPSDSWLAYDFKRRGAADDFGATKDVPSPFRLPLDEEFIREHHAGLGFTRASLIPSLALMQAHVPSWNEAVCPLFDEDALVQVRR